MARHCEVVLQLGDEVDQRVEGPADIVALYWSARTAHWRAAPAG
jgi:hypothetical protein